MLLLSCNRVIDSRVSDKFFYSRHTFVNTDIILHMFPYFDRQLINLILFKQSSEKECSE